MMHAQPSNLGTACYTTGNEMVMLVIGLKLELILM